MFKNIKNTSSATNGELNYTPAENPLETVRKDTNLLLHFIEIAQAPQQTITK